MGMTFNVVGMTGENDQYLSMTYSNAEDVFKKLNIELDWEYYGGTIKPDIIVEAINRHFGSYVDNVYVLGRFFDLMRLAATAQALSKQIIYG